MDVERLATYMKRFKKIDGRFSPWVFWGVMNPVNAVQLALQVKGNWMEIGSFKGKSLIPMMLLAEPHETVVSIEDFRATEKVCCGGTPRPTRPQFFDNVRRYCGNASVKRLKLFEMDSRKVDLNKLAQTGPYRIIHVDGNHREPFVACDFEMAYKVMAPNGLIIVDDYGSSNWPAVKKSVDLWLKTHDHDLKRLGVRENKALFSKEAFAPQLEFLRL